MSQQQEYRVLARKYRPTNFDELIGQEALVRTLSNAIEAGRLAHAFILTGVRGIGKTTTARIIARALNCDNGPTTKPCGTCPTCIAIAEDRHVDVLEMDAASNTGVDDVREIIDSVKYAPASARYKVYIIDEVHMLSKNAFNALLKTLEEPPPHVKFIFATTEIRKVPITVLSRCQRFDLKRVSVEELTQHFTAIAQKESWTIEEGAAALIAKAADGSVRDGLSILDHAGALSDGKISEELVAKMLGLADKNKIADLFQLIFSSNSAGALAALNHLYEYGADPVQVTQDLLAECHMQTRKTLTGDKQDLGRLTRLWQILLKGLHEIATAPQPLVAAEMLMVRAAHVSGLPTPAELIDQMSETVDAPVNTLSPSTPQRNDNVSFANQSTTSQPPRSPAQGTFTASATATAPRLETASTPYAGLGTFQDVAELTASRKESILHVNLFHHVHPVSFTEGHIEIAPTADAPKDVANRLSKFLKDETGRPWMITISTDTRRPTLAMQQNAHLEAVKKEAADSNAVKALITTFSGAKVIGFEPKK